MRMTAMLSVALVMSMSLLALAGEVAKKSKAVNMDANAVALQGHDVVALYNGSVVAGEATITSVHAGAIYRFSSAENRDAFNADPAKFEPQYGGYCALGVTKGYKAPVEISTAMVVDGKLYLNFNQNVQKSWSADSADHIRDADAKWPEVSRKN